MRLAYCSSSSFKASTIMSIIVAVVVFCCSTAFTSGFVATTTPSTNTLLFTPTTSPTTMTSTALFLKSAVSADNLEEVSNNNMDSNNNSDNKSEADSQNVFGVLSDATTGLLFALLHAFDSSDSASSKIQDSSKNLRVLWVRALLHNLGRLDDPVAECFLPSSTRGLVTSSDYLGAKLWQTLATTFTEWIQARTEFIDQGLQDFLDSPVCTSSTTTTIDGKTTTATSFNDCNVVLFGAGYDTRALRYRHAHNDQINFIEVDLPSVCQGKQLLYEQFRDEQEPEWTGLGSNTNSDGDDNMKTHTLVPLDLNTCGPDGVSLIETLRNAGLKPGVPTFFVWEAVLFYVNEDSVRFILQELFDFMNHDDDDTEQDNNNNKNVESMICFTDSLKPFVDVPFSNEARQFFDANNLELLEHRSRWGGAVHFALASTRAATPDEAVDSASPSDGVAVVGEQQSKETTATTTMKATAAATIAAPVGGKIAQYVSERVGGIVNSYTPTQSNNFDLLKNPSFDNVWYAVAYPWQIDGYETPLDAALKRKPHNKNKPFSTRLWGEPLVMYRDADGQIVAMADSCPHRSVPLSMGTMSEDGTTLECMYHGWKFGPKGDCVDVPTATRIMDDDGVLYQARNAERTLQSVTKANCNNIKVAVEHEGLVYIWRGETLAADTSLLPTRRKGDMETVPIDTVLDYAVDYSYIVENNLDSPHLFFLHDGSVPPIESIGMLNTNLPKLKLKPFVDDCGFGHLGRLEGTRPKKLIRFDPPNIVRHGGVSGFEEEFHVTPVAPHRSRVLLRQHLPRGPILSTITNIPGVVPLLTLLVNNWNYHIALEDSNVMIGQSSRIEDWGAPRMTVGGLGDDLIKRFWTWRGKAHDALQKNTQRTSSSSDDEGAKNSSDVVSPYIHSFTDTAAAATNSQSSAQPVNAGGIPTGTSFGDRPDLVQKLRRDSRSLNTPLVAGGSNELDRDGKPIGSWGIKQTYIQETPAANFPPINYKRYASLLVFDTLVKDLLAGDAQEEEQIPIPYRETKKPSCNDELAQGLEQVAYSAASSLRSNTTATSVSY